MSLEYGLRSPFIDVYWACEPYKCQSPSAKSWIGEVLEWDDFIAPNPIDILGVHPGFIVFL